MKPPRRAPLAPADAEALVQAARPGIERLVLVLLSDTGIRVGELAAITPDAVDWQAGRLRVVGKGGKARVVPLSFRARELLSAWWALHARMPARRTAQKIVRRVAQRAGLRRPVSPHVLRHTWTVAALQRGVPVWAVQQLLGHAHLATTEIYARGLAPEDALQAWREHADR